VNALSVFEFSSQKSAVRRLFGRASKVSVITEAAGNGNFSDMKIGFKR
jgi:hypothetical protein